MHKKELILSSIFFLLSFISLAYANEEQETPNLLNIPEQLGIATGIGTFAAGIICTLVLVFMFLLPFEYLTRGKSQLAALILGIGLECFCVAVNWLPIFVLVITVLIIAGLWALRLKGVFT